MKNKTAKQIVAAYRARIALLVIAYMVAVAALIFATTYSWVLGLGGIVVLGMSLRIPMEKIKASTIESVIFEDLDPEKFKEVTSLGPLKNSLRHQVLCEVSLGNHEKALELIETAVSQKKVNPVELCNALYRRGYIHFENGEFDKLPAIVKEYEALKTKYPQFAPAFNNFTVFDKFDAFADEDYEYVVDVCDIDIKVINPQAQNHKLTRINVGFYRAVSLYKLGEMEKAREAFEGIIEFAPKMYKAKLAKDYIDLIDKA